MRAPQPKKIYKIRLKKDDTVIVRTGKYKGQTGKVVATFNNSRHWLDV